MEWGWQFVFPAARICRNPAWGPPSRFHLHESAVQKAVARAAREAGPAPAVLFARNARAGKRLRPTRAPIASVDDTLAGVRFLRGVSTPQPHVRAEAC